MKRIIEILSAASIILLMTGCDQAPKTDLPGKTSETNSTSSASSVQSEEQSGEQGEQSGFSGNINVPVEYEPFNGLPNAEKALGTVNCKDFRPSLLVTAMETHSLCGTARCTSITAKPRNRYLKETRTI